MKVDIIVSRHPAAVEFIAEELGGLVVENEEESTRVVRLSDRTDIPVYDQVTPTQVYGRCVIGNLPLRLACLASTVYAVEFDGPPPRGQEYGVAEMREAGARLTPYTVFVDTYNLRVELLC